MLAGQLVAEPLFNSWYNRVSGMFISNGDEYLLHILQILIDYGEFLRMQEDWHKFQEEVSGFKPQDN